MNTASDPWRNSDKNFHHFLQDFNLSYFPWFRDLTKILLVFYQILAKTYLISKDLGYVLILNVGYENNKF